MSHPVRLVLLFLCAAFLAGCAQNTVRLVYTAPEANTIPTAGAPEVTVVPFADLRAKPPVGQRSDGTDFMPSSSVSEWVTHALVTELSRDGIIATTAASETQARSAGAKYIVTGTVDEVWLTEQSSTEYSSRMRGSVAVKGEKKAMATRSFTSSLSRRVVPLSSVPQEMLSETMRDLVLPMVKVVRENVKP